MEPTDKRKLVKALLECDCIRDRNMRDIIVKDLPKHIRINKRDLSSDLVDVRFIVEACSNYSDGLEELIERLRECEGPTIQMQRVEEIIGGSEWIRIDLQGDRSSIPAEYNELIIDHFLGLLNAGPKRDDTVCAIYEGCVIYSLRIPSKTIQRLRLLLKANDLGLRECPVLNNKIFRVETIILEGESGEIEEWVVKNNKLELATSTYRFQGNAIINLLKQRPNLYNRLDIIDYIKETYYNAELNMLKAPRDAIYFCGKLLDMLPKGPGEGINPRATFTRGKSYLLLASIYLNDNMDLNEANEKYQHSWNDFSSRKWLTLEFFAYLGLGDVLWKLRNFDGAIRAYSGAKDIIENKSFAFDKNTDDIEELKRVVSDRMQKVIGIMTKLSDIQEILMLTSEDDTEKTLKVYNISTGSRTTDLNILSVDNYEPRYPQVKPPEEAIIDLTKYPKAQDADYILLIDDSIDKASDELKKGDWLLVREVISPRRLDKKDVAVLIKERNEKWVGLKVFSYAEDHYSLTTQNSSDAPIIIRKYESDDLSMDDYYSGEKFITKRAYEVQVTGEIIGRIPHERTLDTVIDYVWQIPIVSDIAAGLGVIAEENIEEYCSYRNKRKDVKFGTRVIGDSMAGDNILDGDIVLIRQEPTDNPNEIVAIVIITSEHDSLGVLKRHEAVNQFDKKLRHYLLRSSNSSYKHLVIMPDGADFEKIKEIYGDKVQAGEMILPEFYKNAELAVAGKFVGVCEEN